PEDVQLRPRPAEPVPTEVQHPGEATGRSDAARHDHVDHQGRFGKCGLPADAVLCEELGPRRGQRRQSEPRRDNQRLHRSDSSLDICPPHSRGIAVLPISGEVLSSPFMGRCRRQPAEGLAAFGIPSGSYIAGGSIPNVSARRTKRLNSAATYAASAICSSLHPASRSSWTCSSVTRYAWRVIVSTKSSSRRCGRSRPAASRSPLRSASATGPNASPCNCRNQLCELSQNLHLFRA